MNPNTSLKAINTDMKAGMNQSVPAFDSIPTNSTAAKHDLGFPRQLFDFNQVVTILALSVEAVQQLIDTRQLTLIRIAGQERFDSMEISGLIDAYKRTAMRHAATTKQ